jgi:hypothetical protein
MSATRATIASTQAASPGGDFRDHMPKALLVGPRQPDVPFAGGVLTRHRRRVRVGFQDLRGGDLEHRGWGVSGDCGGHGAVHDRDRGPRHRPRQGSDPPGDPRFALQIQHPTPGQRQPVNQIQGVGDLVPHRHGVHLRGDRKLRQRVLPHPRRALTTRRRQRVPLTDRLTMQHRPLQRDQQLIPPGLTPTTYAILRGSQHGHSVEISVRIHVAILSYRCSKEYL